MHVTGVIKKLLVGSGKLILNVYLFLTVPYLQRFYAGRGTEFFVSITADGSQNAIGYQPHLLQRCRPACGHEGSSHLSRRFSPHDFVS